MSRTASFRVAAPTYDWSQYAAWVAKQFPSYARHDSPGRLNLHRAFPGDSIDIEIRQNVEQPLAVIVVVTARPL